MRFLIIRAYSFNYIPSPPPPHPCYERWLSTCEPLAHIDNLTTYLHPPTHPHLNSAPLLHPTDTQKKPTPPISRSLWAQWENEDLCAPPNPQEFLIKSRSWTPVDPRVPPAPPVPWRSRPSRPTRMDYSSSLCVRRLFPCALFILLPFSGHKRLSPPMVLWKSSRLPLLFTTFFMCVHVRKSVSIMKDPGFG